MTKARVHMVLCGSVGGHRLKLSGTARAFNIALSVFTRTPVHTPKEP